MAQPETTRVDAAALRVIAGRFDAGAETLNGVVRARLGRLSFDGASAGAAYTAAGDALHRGLQRLAAGVAQWARASDEIAVALRISADRYADTEARGASRIGR
jgi:uncharacterized protein YukE